MGVDVYVFWDERCGDWCGNVLWLGIDWVEFYSCVCVNDCEILCVDGDYLGCGNYGC